MKVESENGSVQLLHWTLLLQLFYRVTEEKARQSELYLVGMVCYYGKHYSTFFFQTKIRRWMYFDDAHVKEVYSVMHGVIRRCWW